MSESNVVNWDGLQYYDKKIKQYVSEELSKAIADVPVTDISSIEIQVEDHTKEIDSLWNSVESLNSKAYDVGILSARNNENIQHLLQDVDDLEASVKKDHDAIDSIKEQKSDKGHTHLISDIVDLSIPDVDLSNYYTKDEVDKKIEQIPSQDPCDLNNYYTKDQVYNKIEIDDRFKSLPEYTDVDLSNYYTKDETYTKSEVEALIPNIASKADNIVFTEDAYVGVSLGGFTTGDSLKGLSIKQILTKLLDVNIDKPDEPSVEDPVVQQILRDELTTYSLNIENKFVKNTFEHKILTSDESLLPSSGSFFFTIPDKGLKGYQIDTDNQRHDFLTVAIPDFVTDFKVQQFNMIGNSWQEVGWKFTPKTEQVISGYTTYASNVLSGPVIRIIIEN
jgi:hypothetical protein